MRQELKMIAKSMLKEMSLLIGASAASQRGEPSWRTLQSVMLQGGH
jgi:hypothetical protein